MRRWIVGVVVMGLAAWSAASALDATQAQDGVNAPGMPTIARTFILNRGAAEAVPVVLQRGADIQPVEVLGEPTVHLPPDTAIVSRRARQQWEYREVSMQPGSDLTAALNEAGGDGWEAVGMVGPGAARVVVILKRPR
jgi:hypothetical protein